MVHRKPHFFSLFKLFCSSGSKFYATLKKMVKTSQLGLCLSNKPNLAVGNPISLRKIIIKKSQNKNKENTKKLFHNTQGLGRS